MTAQQLPGVNQTIRVSSAEQMQSEMTRLILQGYSIISQDQNSVYLRKPKQFSMVMFVVGLFLCVLPLFIYLLIYMLQSDHVVHIVLDTPSVAGIDVPSRVLSSDGKQFWDGQSWQPTKN